MITLRTAPCDDGVIAATARAGDCAERSKRWVLVATILGSSMSFVDGAGVNVALPAIQSDLGASILAMQWVVNAYSVPLAALILIGGAAGDRFGRRRIFLIGIALFTVGSLCCGLATGAAALVTARAVQGIGGALLIPSNLAIIGATFDTTERGRAIGTWAAASAIAGALGPVLAGFLVDTISWRAIFFVNLPLAAVTSLITLRHVPESRVASAAPLDLPGAALAACGLGASAFGLIRAGDLGWRHPIVLGGLLCGIVLLALFVRVEARSAAPMVPLTLFRSRSFSGVNLLTLMLYAALTGTFFLLPFALIRLQGYSAVAAGASFLPFTLIMGALSRWSGGLIGRFGARQPLIVGPLVAALGFALFARAGIGGSYWVDVFPPMVILGLGMAISVAPLTTTVLNSVDEAFTGVASGVNNAVAEIAALLAVAIFGAVALAIFDQVLSARLAEVVLSPEASRAAAALGETLAGATLPPSLTGDERHLLEAASSAALLLGFRVLMLAATALAVLGALCAAVMIAPPAERLAARRPA
jgi:EmrB/QacA subfamily drug resistance transporter